MNPVEARRCLVQTYQETGNYSETARRWHTSRHLVRKWVRRYQAEGEAGLQDRSRRPHHCPRHTPPQVEQQVMEAWEKTHYGRRRLALYLRRQKLVISPHTIRHILRRHRPPHTPKRRKPLYPAHWAWEVEDAFSLLQTDVKDVLDKGALGTEITTHLSRCRLPRYQWTACDGRTRLRFLAYSHRNNRTNGLAFMILVLLWLRAFDVDISVTFQTDWGQEFGGDNPEQVARLSQRFLAPLMGQLGRYPKGRKGYNGRVERSHRTDDEEFYRPYLLHIPDTGQFLFYAQRWEYFYNVLRPHFGTGMEESPPLAVLQRLGYTGSRAIASFPPVLLDNMSTDLLMACDPQGGNDLLAHYTLAEFATIAL
ncbi:MAG: helix-turn-helix domain-containing protein, partial [Anaerolineae bacterium]|nr:helix-turn-helix domain-containing protein [Anaerolineae bacterium]